VATLEAIAAVHPGKTLQLWCEDEAREGQKGRTGHRWFTRGMTLLQGSVGKAAWSRMVTERIPPPNPRGIYLAV